MDTPQIIGIALGLGVVALLLLVIFIKTNVVLCQPNELVVISGRRRKLADGAMIGYRVLRGGRGFKRPLVESVGRMPLNSIPVELRIDDVMTDGMIPVSIEAKATVKLAGREADGMDEAIERFLGKGVDAVAKTASQALQGAIRGVVATMSPEEANSKRLELAQQASTRGSQAPRHRPGLPADPGGQRRSGLPGGHRPAPERRGAARCEGGGGEGGGRSASGRGRAATGRA
jgi:flotillin